MENFDTKEDETHVVHDLVEPVYGLLLFVVPSIRHRVGRRGPTVGGIPPRSLREHLTGGMGHGALVHEVHLHPLLHRPDRYLGVLSAHVGGDPIPLPPVIDLTGCVTHPISQVNYPLSLKKYILIVWRLFRNGLVPRRSANQS